MSIKFRVEIAYSVYKDIEIVGWAIGKRPNTELSFQFCEEDGTVVNYVLRRYHRGDVGELKTNSTEENHYGFKLRFPFEKKKKYILSITDGKSIVTKKIDSKYILAKRIFKNLIGDRSIFEILRKRMRTYQKITYMEWYKKTQATKKKLSLQREKKWASDAPKFSIIVPLFKTPDNFLKELVSSIQSQTYSNWELCFADGSPTDELKGLVEGFKDERICYHFIGENLGISGNTNKALEMATGDWIVLCDHDDLLVPNALYEFADRITKDPEIDSIYSDEDKIDETGKKLFEPHFKPDFNIDMLRSNNYICHLYGVRKELVDRVGKFNSQFDGAQDYDFILRMSENSRKVGHVSKILYHWRTHINSTAANPASKMYAFKAGAEAIKAHYARVLPNIKIKDVVNGESLGIYHTIFAFEEYPLISVIIPNKDHTEDLDKAIRSMMEKGTWPNLEFIVVENNSTEEKTWVYYEKIQKEYPQVKVVKYNGEFNYSKINNFGVQYATGGYYLFMNNDVELIEPDSLQELMGYAQREDVGAVGCRLLYEDDTIQHAGVIIGLEGIAGHAFVGQQSHGGTYFNRAMVTQDLSAVTAAVMLVRKEVYEKVAGFGEDFAVAFNDIDFCLKIRRAGYLVVYAAYGCFHHYESKSRGEDDTSAKMERFQSEIGLFIDKWESLLEQGDPYYNPNLSLQSALYSPRNIKYEKIGEPYFNREERERLKKHLSENDDIVKS